MNRPILRSLFLAPILLTSALAPSVGDWTQEELEAVTAVIQKDVEKIREAEFKHPVAVKIIDKAGFLKFAISHTEETTTPDQLKAEETIGKMLGMIPAEMDLLKSTLALLEGQVGGFYDPAGNIFYLMEGFTGGIAKVILAHELTHALDDQYYDLDGGFASRMQNRDSLSAYQAVVEGSGTAAMQHWTLSHLGEINLAELAENDSLGTEAMADAPAALWKPMLASYMAGQAFLTAGQKALKAEAKKLNPGSKPSSVALATVINLAFESPPLSTEQILHPEKYWEKAERDEPLQVEVSIPAPKGWTVLDKTVLGELQLALITEDSKPVDFGNPMSLMGIKYTNSIAAGWGGDQLALYGKDDARMLVVTIAWDTKQDADEFMSAMQPRISNWKDQVDKLDEHKQGSGVELTREGEKRVTFDVWYGFDRTKQ